MLQARGDAVDPRSDLFAVGLVIYYALSGDALYSADTAYTLLLKAAQGPGEKELQNLRNLPREAQRVLQRLLERGTGLAGEVAEVRRAGEVLSPGAEEEPAVGGLVSAV